MSKFTARFAHVGFAIADLDKTMREMERVLGSEFPHILEVEVGDLNYRGSPTNPKLRVGIGSANGVGLELIEQSDESPSPYLEDVKNGFERPHHLAFASTNYDSDNDHLIQQGGEVVFSSNEAGTRFSYYLFEQLPGLMIEVMEVDDDQL